MRLTNTMILPAGLVLLPFVSANLGFWGCLTGTELDNLGFLDRVSCCYSKSLIPDDYDYDYGNDYAYDEPGPEYRLWTGGGPGSSIICWPSKGGIYKLDNVFTTQRQFLGLDRRVPSILRPEVSIEEEDAFCNQIRKLGARWWQYEYMAESTEHQYGLGAETVLYIGWPASGGVWALHSKVWKAWKNGYGVIYNALTMEEQCEMIKEFGGTFYQDSRDCPYLDLAEN
ncbi:hypothetical protein V8C42DRAFT_326335 [Trichoderma barbatum]